MAAAEEQNQEGIASTLVISVGGAGAKMLAAVRRRALEEGVWDDIEYLAIDSKHDDINDHLDPVLEEQVIFDDPERLDIHKQSSEKYDYLPEDAELPPEGGATKRRELGRYYFDTSDNFQSAYQNLQRAYENASSQVADDDNYVNVFLLNAFGGGTGSGSYLLVAALLDFVAREADEDDYRIRGIGTLPRLERTGVVPEYDLRHQVNTYVALRELRTVVGRTSDVSEQRIPLSAEPDKKKENDLVLNHGNSPTFDEYFVLGFDEETPGQNYRQRTNETVADLVLYYGGLEAPEDFPAQDLTDGTRDEVLSLDSAQLRLPVETLFDYLETEVEIDILGDRIESVENQAESFRNDQRYIDSVLELEPGTVPDDEEFDIDDEEHTVKPSFVRLCRDRAKAAEDESFDGDSLVRLGAQTADDLTDESRHARRLGEFGRFEMLDELDREEIDSRHGSDESPPLSDRLEAFGPEDIAEYLVYDHLLDVERTARREAESEFKALVDDLWQGYEEEFRENLPDLHENCDDDHESRAHGLADFFTARIEMLKDKNSSLRFGPLDLTEETEQRRRDKEELEAAFGELERRRKRVEWVEDARQEKKRELSDRVEDFNEAADILREIRADLRAERARLDDQRATYREQLEGFEISTHTTVPMQQLDSLGPAAFAEWVGFDRAGGTDPDAPWNLDELADLRAAVLSSPDPSINAVAADGYVNEDELPTTILTMLSEMEEPVQDRSEIAVSDDLEQTVEGDVYELLAMLTNEANTGEPEDWSDRVNEIATSDANFDQTADHLVSIRDGSTIRLLGVYGNIDFTRTSEFGLLHEYYLDDEREISEVFYGDGNARSEIDDHLGWAYPELVDLGDSSEADSDLEPKSDVS